MIISWLFSKVGIYLVGGLLIAALAFGGKLYLSHLWSKIDWLETTNAQLTADKSKLEEVMKNDLKVEAETQQHKDRIDTLPPAELVAEFKRLREYRRPPGGNPQP